MTDSSPPKAPKPFRARLAPAVQGAAPWAVAAALALGWWKASRRPPVPQPVLPHPPPVQTAADLSQPVAREPTAIAAEEPGRGRLAASPLTIPWEGWRDIVWRTWREISHDKLTVVAGSVTYYTLLAVFPALGVFVSLYGLIADVAAVQAQLIALSSVFPPEAVRLLGDQMLQLATRRPEGLSVAFVTSLLLSIWSANAGMKALFEGLNSAYNERERRPYVLRQIMTYGFTALLIGFLIAISAILVAAPIVLDRIHLRSDWLIGLRWPLVMAVAGTAFTIAYRYGPSRTPARWRWLLPGGVGAAALWIVGSAGFSWYLNNVATLDATYGSLGAVVGFMLWVWFSVLVVLVGAEFNAEIEHQTALDTTVGPAKPMGLRGAAMADTVGRRFVGVREGLIELHGTLDRQVRNVIRRPRASKPEAAGSAPSLVAPPTPVRPRAPTGGRLGPPRSGGRSRRPGPRLP